jgi:phenylacetate-CoA ligase
VVPSQIEEALLRVHAAAPHYLIEVERPGALDEATVSVEVRPECLSDRMSDMQALRDRIAGEIHTITGLDLNVKLVPPQSLERFDGKASRVMDKRRL